MLVLKQSGSALSLSTECQKKEYFYQQRQRQRSNRYQIIADYYLTHSLAETQAAFRIAHRSLITHYFRRAYGISRQEYLTAPR